jgi:hypothetical protein
VGYNAEGLGKHATTVVHGVEARPSEPPLLREFSEHLRELRGNPEITIHKRAFHIREFMAFLRRRHRKLKHARLSDIDAYLLHCRRRFARSTVCDIGGSVRRFMNFLLETGRTRVDLSPLVTVPIVRPAEGHQSAIEAALPRDLPWTQRYPINARVFEHHA